ncbi:MAG: SEL1-like repeat protein [Xanthobacteraceae bacterium]
MTQVELKGLDTANLNEANADVFYQLGILYSAGGEIPADYVTAHKWFNIAAARGNAEATRLRREIAEEMSEAEVASAQRAARDWLQGRAPAAAPAAATANAGQGTGNVVAMRSARQAA